LFFYDLNHYDKRVSSIALRAPAASYGGGFHDPCAKSGIDSGTSFGVTDSSLRVTIPFPVFPIQHSCSRSE
ncbi:hypothetical protein, partial [Dialister invisus]|uniref:hypothetical protein n=1 Tax=Dialister invisus TaxID=218538 RepID=UPI0026760470